MKLAIETVAIETRPTCAYLYGRTEVAAAVPILRCDAEGVSLPTQQVGQRVQGIRGGVLWRRECTIHPLSLQSVGGPGHWALVPREGHRVGITAHLAHKVSRRTQS